PAPGAVALVADEGRRPLVQLVELEAARGVVGAIALEKVVRLVVVQHGAAFDARRGSNRSAGELAAQGDAAAPLRGRALLPCGGPTVPTLEESHADGSSGDGGVLVTPAAVPSLPVLSCQQLPVLPRNWSHQKSVRPVARSPVPLGLTVPSGARPITFP